MVQEKKHRDKTWSQILFLNPDGTPMTVLTGPLRLVKKVREYAKKQNLQDAEGESIPCEVLTSNRIEKHSKPGLMIRGARTREGLTQAQLAAKLNIPQSNLSLMEHDKRVIGKEMAKRLAKILGTDYRLFL